MMENASLWDPMGISVDVTLVTVDTTALGQEVFFVVVLILIKMFSRRPRVVPSGTEFFIYAII